ncbi:hypothetical protein FKM82_007240 [Ascaphus truei]
MSTDLRKRKKDTDDDNAIFQDIPDQEKSQKERNDPLCYLCFRNVMIVLLMIAAGFGVKFYRDNEMVKQQEAAVRLLGTEGLYIFSSLDTDKDMYISPEEFKPIAEKLTVVSTASDYEEEEMLDPSGETLSMAAHFQPLVMDTMTKSKDGFLGIARSALSGLRNWTTAELSNNVFFARQFKPFLPPINTLDLGEPWWIIPSELNLYTGYLPNNRFYPPTPTGKEVIIHKLLSMFHPRPFIKTRFAPQGSVACVRAITDFYYDIAFRIHAEFQLNEHPNFPFWFSPGQFTGHIVISKDASHVRYFKLFVPNNRSLNVDMEWLYGASESSNMEVDIGYLPLMELESLGPSIPSVIYDENGNVIDSMNSQGDPIEFMFEDIIWQSEISWEEAAEKLEVSMYPFKKGLKKTSSMLDEELPRNHQSITNRNELRAVLHLDSLYKENKGSEKPLKTLLEIIAKYFLQHFGKAEHCNVIEEQNPAAAQQLIKRLHLKGLDNSVLNVCDISDDEAGGSSAVSDTCTTQIYRSELNTSFYKIDQSKGSHHKSKKAEGNTKSSRSSAEGERKNVTENRDRFRMSEPTCEVKNATPETQRPKSSRIVRGMMSGPIASSQEDSSKKRTQKRSAGINNIIQIKEEAQTNNILGGTNGASSNYAGSAALQLGKEFSAKGLSAPVSAPATENVRSASLNTTIPVSKEKLEGETNGETQTEESRMSITTNDKNFTFKFPPGVGQERRPRSKKSDNHPSLNRKTLVSISHEEQNHQEDIKLDDVEEELATGEMSMIPAFLPRSKVQVEGKPIDLFQAVEIKKLLFGSSLCCFSDEWKIQSFTFNNRALLKYGFVQKKGGPCGVLAAVQGCVLQNLLFGKDTDSRVLQPSETQRTRCLCNAIADILWRAGDRERAVVALSSGRQQFSPAGRYKADGILETLILYKLGKYEDLMSFLQQNINQFEWSIWLHLVPFTVVFSDL